MRNSHLFRSVVPFGAGLAIGAWAVGSLIVALDDSPSQAAPIVSVEEDSPQWDCLTMGNRVCGADMLTEDLSRQAWDAWDAQQGWTLVQIDPTREYRVDVTAFSRDGLYQAPGTAVIADRDGTRFQYSVSYRD